MFMLHSKLIFHLNINKTKRYKLHKKKIIGIFPIDVAKLTYSVILTIDSTLYVDTITIISIDIARLYGINYQNAKVLELCNTKY